MDSSAASSSSSNNSECYDVCIIGAGPAGLACLSAIREPYSIDSMRDAAVVERAARSIGLHKQLRICVVDPGTSWMQSWKSNFATLRIQHLRSPALAHPDMFDFHSLLVHACQRGREDTELYESGCWDRKDLLGLGQTQVGLWKLPSTNLFADFCDELAARLDHTYFQGKVVEVEEAHGNMYLVTKSDSLGTITYTFARNIVVATGMAGGQIVPRGLTHCPKNVLWNEPEAFPTQPDRPGIDTQRILVVGGGLTAVQTALRVIQDGHQCVLCSRRPLHEKHFDIPVEWFDLRKTNNFLSEFYHTDVKSRLNMLKKARNGGSVPSMYMNLLDKHKDRLTCCVGEAEYLKDAAQEGTSRRVTVVINGSSHIFDKVILACGINPDCSAHPVMEKMLSKWPIATHGGFPDVTPDLQWHASRTNIFVVGAMAALQVGPDAGNLMGMRRAARLVANALDCHGWLRERALTNPFLALWDDSESESDNDSDSKDLCICEGQCDGSENTGTEQDSQRECDTCASVDDEASCSDLTCN